MTNSAAYVVSLGLWLSEENNGRALSTISVAYSVRHSNKEEKIAPCEMGGRCANPCLTTR